MDRLFNWQAISSIESDKEDEEDEDFVPESESSESDDDMDDDDGGEEEDVAQELRALAEEQSQYDAIHGASSREMGPRRQRRVQQAAHSFAEETDNTSATAPTVQFPLNFTMPSVTYYGEHADGSIGAANNNNVQPETSGPCVICRDRPRAIAFMPCRHCSTCEACSPSIQQCPICRQRVQMQIKLYFS